MLSYSDLQDISCFDAEIESSRNCNFLPNDPVFPSCQATDSKRSAVFLPSAALVLNTIWKWKLEIQKQMEEKELDITQKSKIV